MGTGSLVFSLPHFITDQYISSEELAKFVGNNTKDESLCPSEAKAAETVIATLSYYKWFFYLGQFLNGIGAAPLITLATTLLDDCVPKLSAPLYIGIFQTFFVVGPAIGYMLGGSLLEIYVDFETLATDVPFAASSEMWVGAWWVGFVLAWIMAWACALIIFCYPAILPSNTKLPNSLVAVNQAHGESYGTLDKEVKINPDNSFERSQSVLVQIPLSILKLLKNPTYMFISIGGAFDGISLTGLSTFLPKFIQQQYGYTAGVSALLFGVLVTPSGGLGTFSGGYISKRFKLTRNQVLKMYIVCQALTIPCAWAILMYCDSPLRPGVNTPYETVSSENSNSLPSPVLSSFDAKNSAEDSTLSLNNTCNANCGGCGNLAEFMPVCGSDGRQYFNPCYAGCKESKEVNGTKQFSECACVDEDNKTATTDSCNGGCNNFIYFAIIAFLMIWMTFMASMPSVVATLRFVDPEERSLGLGIQSIILRYDSLI